LELDTYYKKKKQTTMTIEQELEQETTERLEAILFSIEVEKDYFDTIMHYNLCGFEIDYEDIPEMVAKIKASLRERKLTELGL